MLSTKRKSWGVYKGKQKWDIRQECSQEHFIFFKVRKYNNILVYKRK